MQTTKLQSRSKETKEYDLEDRTFTFTENVRALVKDVPKAIANIEDAKQVVRASGSVVANYCSEEHKT